MGCGCAGSQPPRQARQRAASKVLPSPNQRRTAGPGQRGYYWEGPQGRPKPPPTDK